jgi:hypothetical protein
VLVADTEFVVWVSMVSAWVVKICCHSGHTQAKSRRGGEASSFNLFLGIGERVNGVWGRGVVGNSERAQVDGYR